MDLGHGQWQVQSEAFDVQAALRQCRLHRLGADDR
jgi:hypothetical protein